MSSKSIESSLPSFMLHADGVKWLIGLSAAGLGGAVSFLGEIQKRSDGAKLAFIALIIALSLSMILGVVYFFRLIAAANAYEAGLRRWVAGGGESQQFSSENDDATKTAIGRYKKVYGPAFLCFTISLALVAAAISWAVWPPPEEKKPEPIAESEMFSLFNTELHHVKGSRRSHTLLLSQKDGRVWELLCERNGRIRFAKVDVEPNLIQKRPN